MREPGTRCRSLFEADWTPHHLTGAKAIAILGRWLRCASLRKRRNVAHGRGKTHEKFLLATRKNPCGFEDRCACYLRRGVVFPLQNRRSTTRIRTHVSNRILLAVGLGAGVVSACRSLPIEVCAGLKLYPVRGNAIGDGWS